MNWQTIERQASNEEVLSSGSVKSVTERFHFGYPESDANNFTFGALSADVTKTVTGNVYEQENMDTSQKEFVWKGINNF